MGTDESQRKERQSFRRAYCWTRVGRGSASRCKDAHCLSIRTRHGCWPPGRPSECARCHESSVLKDRVPRSLQERCLPVGIRSHLGHQSVDLGLQGKRTMVSGASRGLGRACRLALSREGVSVTLVARGEDALRETARATRKCTGDDLRCVACDITTRALCTGQWRTCPPPASGQTGRYGAGGAATDLRLPRPLHRRRTRTRPGCRRSTPSIRGCGDFVRRPPPPSTRASNDEHRDQLRRQVHGRLGPGLHERHACASAPVHAAA